MSLNKGQSTDDNVYTDNDRLQQMKNILDDEYLNDGIQEVTEKTPTLTK